jgi:hypothetical protein
MRTTNESRNSIGGWYGVPGQDANPSFRAPHAYSVRFAETDGTALAPQGLRSGVMSERSRVGSGRGTSVQAPGLLQEGVQASGECRASWRERPGSAGGHGKTALEAFRRGGPDTEQRLAMLTVCVQEL